MQIFHHTLRFTRFTLFIFLVLLAIAITLLRAWILPSVDQSRHHWEKKLSKELGVSLHIQKLRAHLNGLTPELRLIGVSIGPEGNQTQLFDEVQVAIDLPASALTATLTPSLIRILGARLEIQKTDSGDFRIIGLGVTQKDSDLTFGDGRFELLHSEIILHGLAPSTPAITIRDISVRLENQDQDHRLQVFFIPPGQNRGRVHLDTSFAGNLTQPSSWHGHFYLDLEEIQIPPIQQFFSKTGLLSQQNRQWLQPVSKHFSFQQGQGNIRLWGWWEEAYNIKQLQGQLQFQDLSVGQQRPPVTIAEIQTWFRWHSSGQEHTLDLVDFTIHPTLNNNAVHFSLSLNDSDTDRSLKLAARKLDLDSLQAPLQLVISTPKLTALSELYGHAISGILKNFSLEWGQHERRTNHLSVCGQVQQLSFISPNKSWPRLKNITANLCGDMIEGQLYLQTLQAQIAFPNLLKRPIALNKAMGLIVWHHDRSGWNFRSPRLHLVNPDLDASLKLQILWDGKCPLDPALEGTAIISRLRMNAIKNYLPKQTPRSLAAWFNRSPLRGNANGTFLLRGELSRFPFRDDSGIHEALLTTRNLTIDFLPDWPAITQAEGGMSLYNGHLKIQIDQSKFAEATLGPLYGEIKAIGLSPTFDIHGSTSNRIGEALSVLQQSPLKKPVNNLLQWSDIQGAAHLNLSLAIPLTKKKLFHLDGRTTIKNGRMVMKPYPLKLEKLAGTLHFTEKAMQTSLQGLFSGQTAQLHIATEARNTHAKLDTRINAAWLSRHLPPKAANIVNGYTAITASLDIDHNQSIPSRLTFRSDLKGMEIRLPEPLAKPKDEPRPLILTSWLEPTFSHPLNLDFGEIHASLMLDENFIPFRGRIGIGQPPPNPKNSLEGYTIVGHLSRLSVDAWQHFFQSTPLNKSQTPFIAVSLEIDHLWNWERDWGQVSFQAQSKDGLWQGNIETAFTKGKWSYFSQERHLNGQMDFINLTPLTALSASRADDKSPLSLEKLPKINLYTHHLVWNSKDLGPLHLEAFPDKENIRFTLRADTHTHQLHAEGSWSNVSTTPQTLTHGRFRSNNLGKFLKRIGHTTPITETPAKIDFSLRWPGAPYQFSLNTLGGEIELKLGRGRLLDVEPGAGRLLGILYLGTLQRRLRLDFSDLFKSGLAYDRITGTVTMNDGHAATDNLLIESVPARIFVTGEVDLTKKEVNEFVTVIPNTPLTMGFFKYRQNSGIGKAAGLAQKTFNAPLDSLTQSQYAISGTWDDPVITRVRRSLPGTLLHGIWKGLTDITGNKRKNE